MVEVVEADTLTRGAFGWTRGGCAITGDVESIEELNIYKNNDLVRPNNAQKKCLKKRSEQCIGFVRL